MTTGRILACLVAAVLAGSAGADDDWGAMFFAKGGAFVSLQGDFLYRETDNGWGRCTDRSAPKVTNLRGLDETWVTVIGCSGGSNPPRADFPGSPCEHEPHYRIHYRGDLWQIEVMGDCRMDPVS